MRAGICSSVGRRWSWCPKLLVCSVVLGRSAWGTAPEPLVELSCALLNQEQAAEVEARIRASLLTAAVDAQRVSLACEGPLAVAQVDAGPQHVERRFAIAEHNRRESLVEGVEELLWQLSREQRTAAAPPSASELPAASEPASVEAAPPRVAASPPPPIAAPPSPAPSSRADATPRQSTSRSSLELAALGSLELWRDGLAPGASLSAGFARSEVSISLTGGGATVIPSNRFFDAKEWHASVRLGWQPAWAFGCRLHLGGGPSRLVAAPGAAVESRVAGSAAAWFMEGGITRPIPVGHLALLPTLGARWFVAERSVDVDDQRQLSLSGLVPSLALGLQYSIDL